MAHVGRVRDEDRGSGRESASGKSLSPLSALALPSLLTLLSSVTLLASACQTNSDGVGTSSARAPLPPTSVISRLAAPSALAPTPSAAQAAPPGAPPAASDVLLGAPSSDAPARVRLVEVTIGAGLPIDLVKRIVRQNLGRMRVCYQTSLAKKPQLRGQALLDFTITREGDVRAPHASGLSLTDAPLLACLGRTLAGVSFPKPKGAPQNVNVILELEP